MERARFAAASGRMGRGSVLNGDARMDLSVVIPVRNEAPNIAPLVAEIRAALERRLDYEIVYVDDGSSDGTADAVRALAAVFPRLRLVRHRAQRRPERGDPQRRRGGARRPGSPPSTATARTIPPTSRASSDSPARRRREPPLLVAGLRARAARHGGEAAVLAHRQRGARAGSWATRTPGHRLRPQALAPRRFISSCRSSTTITASCRRWCCARAAAPSSVAGQPPAARSAGSSNYGVFDRLWVGIVDLCGVMWLLRRARRPEIVAEDEAAEAPPLARSASSVP